MCAEMQSFPSIYADTLLKGEMVKKEQSDLSSAIKKKSLRESCIGSIKIKAPRFALSTFAPGFVRWVNRYLYPLGLGGVLNRYDSSLNFYSSNKDKQLYSAYPAGSIFCNFGSGAFQHPLWKNYDLAGVSKYYKTLQGKPGRDFFPIDLCTDNLRLPFDNNSVALIYCAHTLEHLEEGKAIRFLSECARILKPSGVMRIVVPNTDSDFNFTQMIYSQDHISETDKLSSMRVSATHLFKQTEKLSDETLLNDMIAADFKPVEFMRIATQERGLSNQFDKASPESHICHWDHSKFIELSAKLGFRCYLPLYQSVTSQLPFNNIEVFDITEPHLSLYGELFGTLSN
jgi:predicted SAM-dependent methyltransferase